MKQADPKIRNFAWRVFGIILVNISIYLYMTPGVEDIVLTILIVETFYSRATPFRVYHLYK